MSDNLAARSIAGGRRAGLAPSVGTGLGGLVHVAAVTHSRANRLRAELELSSM
jgi:threonine/homoserine/homoserine lactone efflux protein